MPGAALGTPKKAHAGPSSQQGAWRAKVRVEVDDEEVEDNLSVMDGREVTPALQHKSWGNECCVHGGCLLQEERH